MKKIIYTLFILGMLMISTSMYLRRVEVNRVKKSPIENFDRGYSDIPEASGL